ncbi:PREDICTED: UPF0503 protein At3g09070, chloroplastic-like [Ipomoea nil]|uniref:UPF0503 protein At3g09070, chloroplastic-like n=1 Tax=Ipomoea nil TaxID=35883 RepID=UPI00090144DD|nr:PREDICTED: UPF0503 protein At3g09070, chloroplastic-like [Ipomoea nil]
MTHKSDSRTRNRTRTRSGCSRHRTQSSTGICAACLRERLSTVEPSDDPDLSSAHIIPALIENPAGNGGCGARRSNAAGDSSSFAPDLRRCRSVSASRLDAAAGSTTEPRRKSCDVGDRNTLALLFDINDKNNAPNADTKVESKNIRFSRLAQCDEELVKDAEIGEEIRVPVNTLQPNVEDAANDDVSMEGELKTMKEYIDLEIQSKSQKPKDLKDIAGNFWEAASVFSKKLRKWSQKQTAKKPGSGDGKRVDRNSNNNALPTRKGKQKVEMLRESRSEIGENAMGRRSCDTEPRFSVDAGRLSVENPKIIMDEPRASWDGGYLVARNTPRIPPRLSVSDSMMLGGGDTISDCNSLSIDGQMQSIMEDESSSGGSGQSNSDSSYSQRESSFDRSSSVWSFDRKGLGLECDESKSASLKLVITERELRDWHLKSVKDHCVEKPEPFPQEPTPLEASKPFNVSKKSTRWKKVCNVFGFKQKRGENLAGESMNTKCSVHDNPEKPKREIEAKELKGVRLMRSNSSIVRGRSSIDKTEMIPSRKSVSEGVAFANTARFLPERTRNGRCTSGHFDNGVLPFYLMPLRSSRSKNSRSMLLNSDCISQNVLN